MLKTLAIRDYAIIDDVEVDLHAGLTVLTGETGAGKSIMVDALGLVLGDRADSAAVRHGAERAEIVAEFDIHGLDDVSSWLAENELIDGDDCILRRVIGADGRSRGFINGRPTPLGQMRDLGERLVDIHGQHEHQSLLKRDVQLALVDTHGALEPLRAKVADAFDAWQEAEAALRTLRTRTDDRAARIELLRFQVHELDALALRPGEIESLEVEHARLANAGRLLEATQIALAASDGDEEVHARALLHRAVSALEEVAALDPALAPIHELLAQALVQLGEGADDLRRWLDRFDLDPERKAFVENRIGTAQQMARKHRVTAAGLPEHRDALEAELADLERFDARHDELKASVERLERGYCGQAGVLHKARVKAARALAGKVTDAMQGLGMQGGHFDIVLDHDPGRFTRSGSDQVDFQVSANPGQPARPLGRVASGGELSRISLAIQVTAAHAATIGCLIFDEVDAGVGGAVAEIVGKRLRELARGRQVLCVTHLPQVASQGHAHLRVVKLTTDGVTRTLLERLEDDARVAELARMLGGVKVTAKTRATAQEMLEAAG